MPLASGREFVAIPGPSVMPDRVLRAMHRAAPNIYAGMMEDITWSVRRDLAKLARTTAEVPLYIGNGHAAWEAALNNVLAEGDRVLVLNTGRFAEGWGNTAAKLGAGVEQIDFGRRATFDPGRVEDALRADTGRKIVAVLAVQVDTSSSVLNDLREVRAAIDAAGHPALFMADCMASLGVEDYAMDALGVDVTTAGSQKGLMTPPGMAMLWVSDKAQAARARAVRASDYWDWVPRIAPQAYYQNFCGTAPTHHLFGLREALDMIAEEGIEAIWARHRALAAAVWAAVGAWGQGGAMELNIAEPALRSHAVTTIRLGAPQATRLREWAEANAGVTLGIGVGMETPEDPKSDGIFRIGHMGHVNAPMVLGVLGTIDTALKALDIPHGGGALDAAAAALAGHQRG